MISIPTNVRAPSILFLGLAILLQTGCAASQGKHTLAAPCDITPGKNVMQAEQNAVRKSHLIIGDVLRIDGTTYILKDEDGKEVSVLTDETTEKVPVNKGDRMTANVDHLNHALWIRANRGTDRRTEHASADCNPN